MQRTGKRLGCWGIGSRIYTPDPLKFVGCLIPLSAAYYELSMFVRKFIRKCRGGPLVRELRICSVLELTPHDLSGLTFGESWMVFGAPLADRTELETQNSNDEKFISQTKASCETKAPGDSAAERCSNVLLLSTYFRTS